MRSSFFLQLLLLKHWQSKSSDTFEVWWDLSDGINYYKCSSDLESEINLKICQYLMKLRRM